jgi:Zn ribbon nucleic-acid-binding protein
MTTDWLELRIWAEQFEDAQKARIAATNRAERGGVDPVIYSDYLDSLAQAEHVCKLHLAKCYRRVVPAPIREWQKSTLGLGQHSIARLLGNLGHPVHAIPHHWEGTGSARTLVSDPPYARTLHQLWQFCGHGAPGARRRGMSADEIGQLGNPKLKTLVHLNAESCMKTLTSPYRAVYDRVRDQSEDKVHSVECVRCGPSGKPAQVGSPWSKAHQHAHALRIVGKELLRDLWIVSGGGQS